MRKIVGILNRINEGATLKEAERVANVLFEAYAQRRKIKPFTISSEDSKLAWEILCRKLEKLEGFGGYKIGTSFVGMLTKKMLKFENPVELVYTVHKAEIEIVAMVNSAVIDEPQANIKLYLGIELPSSRFEPKPDNKYLLQADNGSSSLAFVGPEINYSDLKGKFKLELNGNLLSEGSPNYDVSERLRSLIDRFGKIKGYTFLGNFLEPFQVHRGDIVRVFGSISFEVRFI